MRKTVSETWRLGRKVVPRTPADVWSADIPEPTHAYRERVGIVAGTYDTETEGICRVAGSF